MAAVASLRNLLQIIRSKQDKLSIQDDDFLMNWGDNTCDQIVVGAAAAGAIAWAATVNRNIHLRIFLSAGAAAITARWSLFRSIDSCIDQILCMDGSLLQKELANIMLKRYPNHPETIQHMSKRFYCEHVFDDTTLDIPKSRWRFRNNFAKSATHPQQADTHESSVHDVKIGSERKPVPMNNGYVAMELHPFDCVFGVPPSAEEIRRVVPTTSSRKHSRKHKRSQCMSHTAHQDD